VRGRRKGGKTRTTLRLKSFSEEAPSRIRPTVTKGEKGKKRLKGKKTKKGKKKEDTRCTSSSKYTKGRKKGALNSGAKKKEKEGEKEKPTFSERKNTSSRNSPWTRKGKNGKILSSMEKSLKRAEKRDPATTPEEQMLTMLYTGEDHERQNLTKKKNAVPQSACTY